jgi:hypothetical protein
MNDFRYCPGDPIQSKIAVKEERDGRARAMKLSSSLALALTLAAAVCSAASPPYALLRVEAPDGSYHQRISRFTGTGRFPVDTQLHVFAKVFDVDGRLGLCGYYTVDLEGGWANFLRRQMAASDSYFRLGATRSAT